MVMRSLGFVSGFPSRDEVSLYTRDEAEGQYPKEETCGLRLLKLSYLM